MPPFQPIIYENPQAIAEETKIILPRDLKIRCACESVGDPLAEPRHFDEKGNVLRGKENPQDIGMCQINLDVHGKRAKELGLDLFKEEDNKKYAIILYNEKKEHWKYSKKCWKKYVRH